MKVESKCGKMFPVLNIQRHREEEQAQFPRNLITLARLDELRETIAVYRSTRRPQCTSFPTSFTKLTALYTKKSVCTLFVPSVVCLPGIY